MNCCLWNANGNWLASGSMDGLIKLYDIRTMKELEVWRGQNSEVSDVFLRCAVGCVFSFCWLLGNLEGCVLPDPQFQ